LTVFHSTVPEFSSFAIEAQQYRTSRKMSGICYFCGSGNDIIFSYVLDNRQVHDGERYPCFCSVSFWPCREWLI